MDMTYFARLKKFFRTPWRIAAAVLVVLIVTIGWWFTGNNAPLETIAVTRGTVVQEVRITGVTKPHESVDLVFEKSGIVRAVYAKVGDVVNMGARLAELSRGELEGSLAQAEAQLAGMRAKLDELKRGARPEDIKVKETELRKAEQDLQNYYQQALDTLQEAYTKADDAVRAKTSGIFSGSKATSYYVTFTSCDGQAETDSSFLRLSLEPRLTDWRTGLDTLALSPTPSSLDQELTHARNILNTVKLFLKRTNDLLVTSCTVNNTAYDTYRTNVSTARTSIETILGSASDIAQTTASQKITIAKIEDELSLKRAGATPEQLVAAESEVRRAEGQVAVAQAQIAASIIRAPFSGIITRQDAKVGAFASPNTPLISLTSEHQFEIEAHIPEVEIGRVQLQNPVAITLDAFPSEQFMGVVSMIDPAETMIDGIANYTITIQFNRDDARMKSGLTANLAIETAKKEGVLFLPRVAITETEQGSFARAQENGAIRDIPVTLGIQGKGGIVEILSGVTEGEEVLRVASSATQ